MTLDAIVRLQLILQPTMPTRNFLRAPRLSLALLLALMLLVAQALGQAHRIAHAGGPSVHALHSPAADGSQAQEPVNEHHEDGDCRLYDQLALADWLGDVPPVIAVLPQGSDLPAVARSTASGGVAAVYQARAPPLPG
jgi:hypothetical protein